MLPWILCILLAAALAAALLKIRLLRHDIRHISKQLGRLLPENTNEPLTTQSGDREIRAVAVQLNKQLDLLRQQQRKYLSGDLELKNAVTNISHDLRTPLTAIKGYLDLLRSEPLSAEAERYLNIIAERTEQMHQLTEEMFRYSLILSGDNEVTVETVCINTVLEESIAGFFGALTCRGITPEITMPEQQIFCKCNRTALMRIFANLLQNAMKYSRGDLRITLSADGTAVFENHTESVAYTHIEHLFDRFYTVDSAQHSTGLGLAIARTLTEQTGGTIRAEFESDLLRMILTFPCISP